MTLCGFGEHARYPADIVEAARVASSRISAQRFVTTFDEAVTFGRSKTLQPLPYVLAARHSAGLTELKRTLDRSIGLSSNSAFAPHMTLTYDEKIIRPTMFEPISWEVDEFVLIHTQRKERNRPKKPYEIVGRWKLL